MFISLPTLEAIAETAEANVYCVTLREPGGTAKSALFTLQEESIPHASTDWDIFWDWPGDAESLRSVVRRVFEYHHERERR